MGFRTQRLRKRSIRLLKEFYKAIKANEKFYNSKTPLKIIFSVKDIEKTKNIYKMVWFLSGCYPDLISDFHHNKENFWVKLKPDFINIVEHNWSQEKWIKKHY